MQNRFITYKTSAIHYRLFGNGSELLFCFHGYGENAESFAFLAEALGRDYTLVAIDMPFHGKTEWKENLLFTPQQLVEIITQITNQLPNQSTNHPINLLGYSMGGRVVLQLLQLIPSQIKRAVLVAPDGLHKNKLYRFVTQTAIGSKLFKHAMYKPKRLLWVLNHAGRFKLAHTAIIKIGHYYLDDGAERIKLYERWTTMRRFKPNLLQARQQITKHAVQVRFLFGKYDSIILSKRSDVFTEDIHHVQVRVIDAGHRLMQEKYVAEIVRLLYE